MKLLLHACCGPCSIMPTRLLAEEGHDITVFYSNSNIAPPAEYEKRLGELRRYADLQGVSVAAGRYDQATWERDVEPVAQAVAHGEGGVTREDRCRACYRLRLEDAAAYAAEHGFQGISTTLAVSPYQLSEVMHEELDRAAGMGGLAPVFRDFRPWYDEATRISRELNMYRQNYCGCRYSIAEAEATRTAIRAQRAAEKEARAAARAAEEAAHADERAAAAAAKRAYEEKQARKRALRNQLRGLH